MGSTELPNHGLTGSLLESEASEQERLDRKADLERKLGKARWERVFMNPDGAIILWLILEECGLLGHHHPESKSLGTSFTGNSTTFFLEGKRSVAFWLLRELDALKKERFAQICQLATIPDEGDEENE